MPREFLQNIMFAGRSTILENSDGCAKQYICATALYLLSILDHFYYIIINCCVGIKGHVLEVFDIRNAIKNDLYPC